MQQKGCSLRLGGLGPSSSLLRRRSMHLEYKGRCEADVLRMHILDGLHGCEVPWHPGLGGPEQKVKVKNTKHKFNQLVEFVNQK